jgi:hypothetical protein
MMNPSVSYENVSSGSMFRRLMNDIFHAVNSEFSTLVLFAETAQPMRHACV